MTEAEKRKHRCCFTGHRPEKLHCSEEAYRAELEREIRRAIDDGLHTFISGVAWGVDIVAAEVVLQHKASDPTVHLICAVPHPGFEKRMGEAWQQRYKAVLENADIVRTISQTQSRGCYQTRNENDSSWKFIDAFIERTEYRRKFVELLIHDWRGMWKHISENAVLSYERKIFYLEQLINSCEKIESIADMNTDGALTCFLEGHEDILQQLHNSDEKKLADLIDLLDVKFYKLNIESVSSNLLSFVFDNCHYIINALMLQRVVEFNKSRCVHGGMCATHS